MAHRFPMETLDTASYSLKCGVDLLGALHTAIEEGSFKAESYTDAIHAVWILLNGISNEIAGCVEDYYEQQRKYKEANEHE